MELRKEIIETVKIKPNVNIWSSDKDKFLDKPDLENRPIFPGWTLILTNLASKPGKRF